MSIMYSIDLWNCLFAPINVFMKSFCFILGLEDTLNKQAMKESIVA